MLGGDPYMFQIHREVDAEQVTMEGNSCTDRIIVVGKGEFRQQDIMQEKECDCPSGGLRDWSRGYMASQGWSADWEAKIIGRSGTTCFNLTFTPIDFQS